MQRRSLIFALAVGAVLWGCGALEVRAANIAFPPTTSTTLDQLLIPGNTATVQALGEVDTFSNFAYSVSSNPASPLLPASAITVTAFPFPAGGALESGLTFSGAINAPMNTTVDYKLSYTVSAPAGSMLTDAQLGVTWNPFGGTGSGSVGESLSNGASFPGGGLFSFNNGPVSINFAPVQSITVAKDILLTGGTLGIGVSVVSQAFSSSPIPEPASFALLGIGMTGFLAFRRFFKRTSVA